MSVARMRQELRDQKGYQLDRHSDAQVAEIWRKELASRKIIRRTPWPKLYDRSEVITIDDRLAYRDEYGTIFYLA